MYLIHSIIVAVTVSSNCWRESINPFVPTVSIFAVRETAPANALRALSTLSGLKGAPEVPPLCRETQSLEQ